MRLFTLTLSLCGVLVCGSLYGGQNKHGSPERAASRDIGGFPGLSLVNNTGYMVNLERFTTKLGVTVESLHDHAQEPELWNYIKQLRPNSRKMVRFGWCSHYGVSNESVVYNFVGVLPVMSEFASSHAPFTRDSVRLDNYGFRILFENREYINESEVTTDTPERSRAAEFPIKFSGNDRVKAELAVLMIPKYTFERQNLVHATFEYPGDSTQPSGARDYAWNFCWFDDLPNLKITLDFDYKLKIDGKEFDIGSQVIKRNNGNPYINLKLDGKNVPYFLMTNRVKVTSDYAEGRAEAEFPIKATANNQFDLVKDAIDINNTGYEIEVKYQNGIAYFKRAGSRDQYAELLTRPTTYTNVVASDGSQAQAVLDSNLGDLQEVTYKGVKYVYRSSDKKIKRVGQFVFSDFKIVNGSIVQLFEITDGNYNPLSVELVQALPNEIYRIRHDNRVYDYDFYLRQLKPQGEYNYLSFEIAGGSITIIRPHAEPDYGNTGGNSNGQTGGNTGSSWNTGGSSTDSGSWNDNSGNTGGTDWNSGDSSNTGGSSWDSGSSWSGEYVPANDL